MRHIIWVLWPAFIAAGIAEIVFFTVIDPQQLYFFGQPVALPAMPTYSIGFLLFWVICAGSSLLSWFILKTSVSGEQSGLKSGRLGFSRSRKESPDG